jgi:hypothetical protein
MRAREIVQIEGSKDLKTPSLSLQLLPIPF